MPNYNYGWQYGMQPMYQQQQQMTDERIWVANEQAADSYLVAPNSLVRLWDSNKNVFYEKRADSTGRLYPMESYEYKKLDNNNRQPEEIFDYKKEIENLNKRISVLEGAKKHEQSNSNNKRA